MTTMFGIPKSKIHKVKNPYKPTEILKKFDEDSTAFVTVVGEKDKNRLGGKIGYVIFDEKFSKEIDSKLDFFLLEEISKRFN